MGRQGEGKQIIFSILAQPDITIKCLSIGHLEIINFPFVPNAEFIIFRCPKIWAHYSPVTMHLNTGTPKNHKFSI